MHRERVKPEKERIPNSHLTEKEFPFVRGRSGKKEHQSIPQKGGRKKKRKWQEKKINQGRSCKKKGK